MGYFDGIPIHVAGAGDCGCLWPWTPEWPLCHCTSNVIFFARTVRGATISLVKREFILAARLGGASHFDVLSRELMPNILPVIVVTISTTAGWMILETAGLSFSGLGAQPPTADLGSMLG